jgi:hypothetical protein
MVEQACAAALELGVHEYPFVRGYLERQPPLPLTLQQVDPLIRELEQYRDLIQLRIKESESRFHLMTDKIFILTDTFHFMTEPTRTTTTTH